jgi:hypothetical protein
MLAENYFGDCQYWSLDRLAIELEMTGYHLAREGKTDEAKAVFIAVSELIKVSNSSGTG